MAEQYKFLSLQGRSQIALNVVSGVRVLRELGNQTSVKLAIKADTYSKNETKTGQRQKVGEWTKARSVDMTLTLDEQKPEDIALAFQADYQDIASGSVQDMDLGSGLKVGDVIKLDGFNLSSVMISDSTPSTPVQLVEGTHYTLDADFGKITIKSLTGLTQPLVADYTTGGVKASTLFTLPDTSEYYFLFEGIDTISDEKLALELWRLKPTVDSEMDFINEETGEITIKGSALADTQKQADSTLGGFGRIVYLG